MGDYATKPINRMGSQSGFLPQDGTGPVSSNVAQPRTYKDYRDAPPQGPIPSMPGAISGMVGWDPNRGDPNIRKAAKLVVEEPKAAAPKAPAPAQVAAQQQAAAKAKQQQAAAIAAQQAAFWAQHEASQRMKAERERANQGGG